MARRLVAGIFVAWEHGGFPCAALNDHNIPLPSRVIRGRPFFDKQGAVCGAVSPGKVRHECRESPAPTLGFPRKYGRLSLMVNA